MYQQITYFGKPFHKMPQYLHNIGVGVSLRGPRGSTMTDPPAAAAVWLLELISVKILNGCKTLIHTKVLSNFPKPKLILYSL